MKKKEIHKHKHNPEQGTKRRLWRKKKNPAWQNNILIHQMYCKQRSDAQLRHQENACKQNETNEQKHAAKPVTATQVLRTCGGALSRTAQQLERQTGRARTADNKSSSGNWHIQPLNNLIWNEEVERKCIKNTWVIQILTKTLKQLTSHRVTRYTFPLLFKTHQSVVLFFSFHHKPLLVLCFFVKLHSFHTLSCCWQQRHNRKLYWILPMSVTIMSHFHGKIHVTFSDSQPFSTKCASPYTWMCTESGSDNSSDERSTWKRLNENLMFVKNIRVCHMQTDESPSGWSCWCLLPPTPTRASRKRQSNGGRD